MISVLVCPFAYTTIISRDEKQRLHKDKYATSLLYRNGIDKIKKPED